MIPQSRSFLTTFDDLMRDFDRRLLTQERRSQHAISGANVTLVAVATVAEVIDPEAWYYVLEDSLVHHQGTTMTYAQWLAQLP